MVRRSTATRRAFLRRTACLAGGALAAPVAVPGSALGLGAAVPPSGRVTVGMIGMGRQAYKVNLKQFLGMADVQVAAVCDVDSWRLDNALKAVEKRYAGSGRAGGCRSYVDWRELLARDEIQAVMISTPDHWHAPMTLEAFRAGKDVSLEKPITRTIAEGRAISDRGRKLKRVFRVDSELRSNPSAYRAADAVRAGRLGAIRRIVVGVPGSDVPCPPQPVMPVPAELDYERWQGPAPRAPYTVRRVHPPRSYGRPGWMRHLYYCDGMITNWGTHLNDGAMWAADLDRTGPVAVEGTGAYPDKESFWNVLVSFEVRYRFANGIEWIYKTERPYFRIEGENGWVQGGFGGLKAEPASLLDEKRRPGEPAALKPKSDKRDFIDAVKYRAETLEPAEVGHRVTSLCHLGHIAIQVGGKLGWDPEKERFTGNDAANALIDKPVHEPRHA
jgi:predicted dehydrogenase